MVYLTSLGDFGLQSLSPATQNYITHLTFFQLLFLNILQSCLKEIETTKTLSDYIPENLSSKAINILLDDELGLKNHDLKLIFDHYKTSDIEDICEDLWKCWDSPKIMSKQGLFRGKIKQLDKKKTVNLNFFDGI